MWLAELASQDCRCRTVDWLAERIAAPALTGAGAGATAAANAVLAAAWSEPWPRTLESSVPLWRIRPVQARADHHRELQEVGFMPTSA
jgi:hypothetical protein